MQDDERRTSRRFHLTLPLVVQYPPEKAESGQAVANTKDVSFRGLYFTVDKEFQPDSPLEFVLTLPKEVTLAGDVRIHCTGHIVRVEPPAQSGQWGVAAQIDRYEFLPDENN